MALRLHPHPSSFQVGPGTLRPTGINHARILNQRGLAPVAAPPREVVHWFGAMQSQDYGAAKWAIGLRTPSDTAVDVEHAFNQGEILRTHVLRPTWHFVSPSDIRWMLKLTGDRVRRAQSSYNRKLGLDAVVFSRATSVFERSLRESAFLTRVELGERLKQNGMVLDRAQLAQVAMNAELEGVICSGPRRGKQFTYALLSERAPSATVLQRDEALAALAHRFLRSHGPATFRDFAWWSGMTIGDARRGFAMNSARRHNLDGLAYWTLGADHCPGMGDELPDGVALLPAYDEYSVAYRDRVSDPGSVPGVPSVIAATGTVGSWRVIRVAAALRLSVLVPNGLPNSQRRALARAVDRFSAFHAMPCRCSVARRRP